MRTLIFRSLLLSIAVAAFCGVAGAVGPQGKDLHRDRRDTLAHVPLDFTRGVFLEGAVPGDAVQFRI